MIRINLNSSKDKVELSRIGEHITWGFQNTAFVFDFDGVLCSPMEDAVYRLTEKSGERERLSSVALHYGLRPEIYDVKYLRHLVFQAILSDRDIPVEPGPLMEVALQLSQLGVPIFILSARSGPPAVARALNFLGTAGITAEETFFVGRVGKGRQLSHLRSLPGVRHIVYFDDNIRHTRNAFEQKGDGIIAIHVGWRDSQVEKEAERLLHKQLRWFERERNGRRTIKGASA